MLDLALTIVFGFIAVQIARAIYREAAVFREFNQPKRLALLVFLFPLGPLILLVGTLYLPFSIAVIPAAVCYFPALFVARRCIRGFERTGTDHAKRAQNAAFQAFAAAVSGLVYVFVVLLFGIAARAI